MTNESDIQLARVRETIRRFRPFDCDVEYLEARNEPFKVPKYVRKVMEQVLREISDLKDNKKGA